MFDTCPPILAMTQEAQVHRLSVQIGKRLLSAKVRVPVNATMDLPPLLALHGISRDATGIANAFSTPCSNAGQVLITPLFSDDQWPHFQQIGTHRPDRALLALLGLVQDMGFAKTDRVTLFGYSGGAQLAHRFAMLYPQRVAALHVAAAGWYCLPDLTAPFPMGLGASEAPLKFDVPALAHGQLNAYLRLKVRLYVGADDTERDRALRKDAPLDDVQGRHRLARARTLARSFRAAAQARIIAPDLSLTELPDCGHSFSDCARAGLTRLVCNS